MTRNVTVTGSHLRGRFQFQWTLLCDVVGSARHDSDRVRAGGPGASIRFAVGECSLGSILVAATEKGSARSYSATIRRPRCANSRLLPGPGGRWRYRLRAPGGSGSSVSWRNRRSVSICHQGRRSNSAIPAGSTTSYTRSRGPHRRPHRGAGGRAGLCDQHLAVAPHTGRAQPGWGSPAIAGGWSASGFLLAREAAFRVAQNGCAVSSLCACR